MQGVLGYLLFGAICLGMGLFILLKGQGKRFLSGLLFSLFGLGLVVYPLLMLVGGWGGIVVGALVIVLGLAPVLVRRGLPAGQVPRWIAVGRGVAPVLIVLGLVIAVEGALAVTGLIRLSTGRP